MIKVMGGWMVRMNKWLDGCVVRRMGGWVLKVNK